jgi:hypothetical protein
MHCAHRLAFENFTLPPWYALRLLDATTSNATTLCFDEVVLVPILRQFFPNSGA